MPDYLLWREGAWRCSGMPGPIARACILLALCSLGRAAFISLVSRGGRQGLLFSDPTVWSGGVVPGPADDVVVAEACLSTGDFQWLLVDVDAHVQSLAVQASPISSIHSNCSTPSLKVAAAVHVTVTGSLVVGVTGPGLLFLETSSAVEWGSGVVGEQGAVVGSGTFVAHSTVQIAGSLWPVGTGIPVCCRAGYWPGSWNASGAPTGDLVIGAPEIDLVGAEVTISGAGQFLRLEGRVNSSLSSLQIAPKADVVGQQVIT
jgi:hypothetical protein